MMRRSFEIEPQLDEIARENLHPENAHFEGIFPPAYSHTLAQVALVTGKEQRPIVYNGGNLDRIETDPTNNLCEIYFKDGKKATFRLHSIRKLDVTCLTTLGQPYTIKT